MDGSLGVWVGEAGIKLGFISILFLGSSGRNPEVVLAVAPGRVRGER